MRLLAKPSFVPQPKPAQRRRIGDQRALWKLVIIVRVPSPDISLDRPESDQRDDPKNEVAISPAKPPIRTDPEAFPAAIRAIVNFRATSRTFHCWSSEGFEL